MSGFDKAGAFKLGSRTVKRLGYGAMQLAGRGVFGPPKDHAAALAVLRAAVAHGVNHIDTADFYGPHHTNRIIREALAPYPDNLVIATKVSSRRGEDGSWIPAFSREELTQAIHQNLRHLGLDVLDVVNLRSYFSTFAPQLANTLYAEEIWAHYESGVLNPDLPLTGHFAIDERPADVDAVLEQVELAIEEEALRQMFSSK